MVLVVQPGMVAQVGVMAQVGVVAQVVRPLPSHSHSHIGMLTQTLANIHTHAHPRIHTLTHTLTHCLTHRFIAEADCFCLFTKLMGEVCAVKNDG